MAEKGIRVIRAEYAIKAAEARLAELTSGAQQAEARVNELRAAAAAATAAQPAPQ